RLRLTVAETFAEVVPGALRRGRFDVVHATTAWAAVAARLVTRRVVFTTLGHPSRHDFGLRASNTPAFTGEAFVAATRSAARVTPLSRTPAGDGDGIPGRRPQALPPA